VGGEIVIMGGKVCGGENISEGKIRGVRDRNMAEGIATQELGLLVKVYKGDDDVVLSLLLTWV